MSTGTETDGDAFGARMQTIERSLTIEDLDAATANLEAFIRTDTWQNLATSLGVEGKDHRLNSKFRRGREIQRQEYEGMYIEDPIFAKVIDQIPEHGTRKWIKVTAQDAEDDAGGNVDADFSQNTLDALEDLDAQAQFFELWRLARLDGGSAMLIGADDGQMPDKELNLDRIKTVSHLNVVTRFEIFPTDIIEDITSPFFREPEFYMFTGKANARAAGIVNRNTTNSMRKQALLGLGAQAIHHSRVIRMRGIILSESLDRTQGTSVLEDFNWGTPFVQRVYDDLRQYNTIFGHVEAGFKDMSQGVFGYKNLAEILSTTKGNEKLLKRMTLIALAASTFNMVLIDPEFESYTKTTATFSGVESVLIRFMEKLAASAEIPMTKLFGLAPAGLSTDDKSGEKTFNASIANKQRRKLRKPINRVVDALLHAKDGPTSGSVPEKWKVTFIPLDEPNETENATRRKAEAETDTLLINSGQIDLVEARSRIKNDPESPYTLNSERDKALEEMNDPMTELEISKETAELGLAALRGEPPEGGSDGAAAGGGPGESQQGGGEGEDGEDRDDAAHQGRRRRKKKR